MEQGVEEDERGPRWMDDGTGRDGMGRDATRGDGTRQDTEDRDSQTVRNRFQVPGPLLTSLRRDAVAPASAGGWRTSYRPRKTPGFSVKRDSSAATSEERSNYTSQTPAREF